MNYEEWENWYVQFKNLKLKNGVCVCVCALLVSKLKKIKAPITRPQIPKVFITFNPNIAVFKEFIGFASFATNTQHNLKPHIAHSQSS